jgi:halimadienyl-diphosphate synthase
MHLQTEIKDLIQELGASKIASTAYDTAIVARYIDSDIGEKALNWLRQNQWADGSWGGRVYYGHDRLVSTLAASVALKVNGNKNDEGRIRAARLGFDRAISCLAGDISGATVGFEMLAPWLLDTAKSLGLISRMSNIGRRFPEESHDARRRSDTIAVLRQKREDKIAYLPDGMISRFTPTAFSAEMAGDNVKLVDENNILEANGSVGCSPSATAYFVGMLDSKNTNARAHLGDVINGDGGVPVISEFQIFEISWGLWNLSLSSRDDVRDMTQHHLDFLESAWSPEIGLGFSPNYTPSDGDDTSLVYAVLNQYGRSVDVDPVLFYEVQDQDTGGHFCCYHKETDISISANAHALEALQTAGFDEKHPSIQNILGYLKKAQVLDTFWYDKWHSSPYYGTSHVIIAGAKLPDLEFHRLITNSISWIINTQMNNGAWGYYGIPTAEETAFCLQALFMWRRAGGKVPDKVLKRGYNWLRRNMEPPYNRLWICKCLYNPVLITRSVILSALVLGEQEL